MKKSMCQAALLAMLAPLRLDELAGDPVQHALAPFVRRRPTCEVVVDVATSGSRAATNAIGTLRAGRIARRRRCHTTHRCGDVLSFSRRPSPPLSPKTVPG